MDIISQKPQSLISIQEDSDLSSVKNTYSPAPPGEVQNTVALISILTVESLIGLGILVSNSLILAAFYRCPKLRKKLTNYYLLQLSIADFLAGVFLFFHVIFALESTVKDSEWGCVAYYCAIMYVCCVSMLSLIGITLDRFVAIVSPFYYRTHMGRKRTLIYCVFIQLFPFLLCVVIPLAWHNSKSAEQRCDAVTILNWYYIACVLIPLFFGLAIFKSVLYFLIFWITRQRVKMFASLSNDSTKPNKDACLPHQQKAHQQNVALAKTGALVVSVFIACWMPFFIVVMIQVYAGFINKTMEYIRMAAFLLILLCSICNPIIYVYRMPSFRREVKALFCCAKAPNIDSSLTLDNSTSRAGRNEIVNGVNHSSAGSGILSSSLELSGNVATIVYSSNCKLNAHKRGRCINGVWSTNRNSSLPDLHRQIYLPKGTSFNAKGKSHFPPRKGSLDPTLYGSKCTCNSTITLSRTASADAIAHL